MTEKLDFVSVETVWTHKTCSILLFQYFARKKRNKVSMMPHSTYLFIPCPQSNAKKCYAKELKGKIKKKNIRIGTTNL